MQKNYYGAIGGASFGITNIQNTGIYLFQLIKRFINSGLFMEVGENLMNNDILYSCKPIIDISAAPKVINALFKKCRRLYIFLL